MTHHLKTLLLLLAIAAVAERCFAQAPAAAPAPADAAAPAAADTESTLLLEDSPAIRAALTLPRQKPSDYLDVVMALVALDRPELAKPIMEELAALQLTDEQRADLVNQFGSVTMLQLARAKALAPASVQFADACMKAAAAKTNDGQAVAALLNDMLTNPSPEARALARNDLIATGRAGVIATLQALANETDANRRTILLSAAVRMDPLVRGPLLAMLDTEDAALRTSVAELLQHLHVPQAAPLLPASSASAERALTHAISQYRAGMQPFELDENLQAEIWRWCDNSKTLSSARMPADDAPIIWMSRLAQQRAWLEPNNGDFARSAMLLTLEANALLRQAVREGGLVDCAPTASQSYFQNLTSAEPSLLNSLLADALESGYANAAIAITNELGRRRDPSVLFTADAQPSPLAAALHSPNRRVRFAALEAIMSIDPTSPFPGASRVPEALVWFAGASGERVAVVAMPSLAAATNLAGKLNANQLYAEATNVGLQAVKIARQSPDLEMVFVDHDIDGRGVRDALYELRIHPATGEVPIALLAPDGELMAAENLAGEHERIIAVPRLHSAEHITRVIEQLHQLAGRDATTPEERLAQADQARRWLDQLEATRHFYTIRRPAQLNQASLRPATPPPAPPTSASLPDAELPAPPES
jgi:hypothetical protein